MSESAEELQRRIAALKLQIAQAEAAKVQPQRPSGHTTAAAADHEEDDSEEYYEEEVIEEEVSPRGCPRPTATAAARAAPAAQPAPAHASQLQKMEQLKQRHGFERPGWATQADAATDKAILDDAIDHGLKQAGQAGQYQRQVKEATPVIVKGSHVAPKPKVEPRLTWIVINVNKRKVGKVVMHLYGKDVHTIVDNFVELKGFELVRANGRLAVSGVSPAFVVMNGGSAGLDNKPGVYGVIQEGQDVFQQVMAADADAALSIKQAHIYPVKVGRS